METKDWRMLLSEPGYVVQPAGLGASEMELAELAKWFGCPLPKDYVTFLHLYNGAAVQYKSLWTIYLYPSTQIPKVAEGYGVGPPNLSGAVLFGTDLGPFGLIFDTRPHHPEGHYPILAVDWVVLSWEDAILVADDFRSLLTLRRHLLPEA